MIFTGSPSTGGPNRGGAHTDGSETCEGLKHVAFLCLGAKNMEAMSASQNDLSLYNLKKCDVTKRQKYVDKATGAVSYCFAQNF